MSVFVVTICAAVSLILLCKGESWLPVAVHSASGEASFSSNCSSGESTCPAGLFCSEGQCECKPLLNDKVVCEKRGNEVYLMVPYGYCVTNEEDGEVSVGACSAPMHNSSCLSLKPGLYSLYYSMFPGQLNKACARTGRTGVLCGRCLPGHSPLAYAYNLTCISCPHSHFNWLWYIMAAFLPLTLFYFFILFFNVKTMSAHLYIAIYLCQIITAPPILRYYNNMCIFWGIDFWAVSIRVIASLYGIWNLDFFRLFYSNLCLDIGVLPMLALDYAIAVYPLLLMVVSYLLITLYDRNYRVVTAMWSPFRRLFFLFKRNWNIKTSVIDSFATFFVLSNIKFLSVSCDFLFPTTIHHFDGNNYTSSLGLLYAPDIEYFGKQHFPFGVLAIAVLFFAFFLPVSLLAVYPFKFFQRFLNLFHFRWYILHTFMDSFLGCYKDGTQPGTRDCRAFLALILLSRLLLFVAFGTTETMIAYAATVLCGLGFSAVFLVAKPFKTPPRHSNLIVNIYLLLLLLIIFCLVALNISCYFASKWCNIFNASLGIACCIPLFDALRVTIVYTFKRRHSIMSPLMHCWRRQRKQFDGYEVLTGEGVAGEGGEEVVADRIKNPENYLAGNLPSIASFQEPRNGEETY